MHATHPLNRTGRPPRRQSGPALSPRLLEHASDEARRREITVSQLLEEVYSLWCATLAQERHDSIDGGRIVTRPADSFTVAPMRRR
jgi:hypothetical protein